MKSFIKKSRSGFTLIELLVAMSITSILVVIIVGLTSVALNSFKGAREDVVSARSARSALFTLRTDLESIQYRAGNNYEWLYAGRDAYFDQRNMKLGPRERRAANAVQLLFFSSAPDRRSSMDAMGQELDSVRSNGGDVNLIGYRLVYRDHILDEDASETNQGYPIFALYRNVVGSEATYRGGEGGQALLGQRNLSTAYSSRERTEAVPTNFLAENIVEFTLAFEVEYISRGGGAASTGSNKSVKTIPIFATRGKISVADADEFRLRGNGISIRGSGGSNPGLEEGRLAAITVSMTVITDEGMTRIDQLRQGNRMPNERDFFSKYSRSYHMRVPIQIR